MADATVPTLNSLIETVKDGEEGFRTASENVKDPNIKSTFDEFARQRHAFASELQSEVQKRGAETTQSGSAASAVHRGWINLKSAMGGGEKAILAEAERGEDYAVKGYEKALSSQLPSDLNGVVQRQYSQVKSAHDRVKQLRDSWK